MKQLESDFQQRAINLNKFQTELTEKVQNRYLDYLIKPCFQRVNRYFVLLFENKDDREVQTRYFLREIEIKDCNGCDRWKKCLLPASTEIPFTIRTRRWLDNWMITRLYLFQRKLEANCNRFKQATKIRCWSKSNTRN